MPIDGTVMHFYLTITLLTPHPTSTEPLAQLTRYYLTRTHSNSLELTRTHSNSLELTRTHSNSLELTRTHSNSLELTRTHSNSLELITHLDYIFTSTIVDISYPLLTSPLFELPLVNYKLTPVNRYHHDIT